MAKLEFFVYVLIVQLFWSLGVTLLVGVLPAEYLADNVVADFTTKAGADSLQTVAPQVQERVETQLNIQLVDAATLIFYSGNLIISLIMNFLSAVPQMFALIIAGITLFVPVEYHLKHTIQVFIMVLVAVLYIIGFVTTITSLRSGTNVA